MNERRYYPVADILRKFGKKPRRRAAPKERGIPRHLAESLETPKNVESERLLELFRFVTQPSIIRPPQVDTVSGARLSQGGFTLGEANYIFDELYRLEGTTVVEEYRTYRAMQRAIQVLLAHRDNGKKDTFLSKS